MRNKAVSLRVAVEDDLAGLLDIQQRHLRGIQTICRRNRYLR